MQMNNSRKIFINAKKCKCENLILKILWTNRNDPPNGGELSTSDVPYDRQYSVCTLSRRKTSFSVVRTDRQYAYSGKIPYAFL